MYRAALWLGASFFCLFSGYNALQALLPALRPQAGPLTIALAYVAYAGAALAPPCARTDDRRLVLAWAAFSFVLWIAATRGGDAWLAAAAVLNGAGSGLLWTNEGAWLSDLARGEQSGSAHAPRYAAIVLIAFHSATLLGQALLYWAPQSVFWLAISSASLGTLLLLGTPDRWLAANKDDAEPIGSICELLRSAWPKLVPEILLFGCASALVWVGVPKALQEERAIGTAIAVFALASVVGFFAAAQAVRPKAIKIMALCACAAHGLLWGALLLVDLSAQPLIAYGAMAVAGAANAALNQAIVVRQTQMLRRAFSCQVALYCVAYAASAALLAWSLRVTLLLAVMLSVASCGVAVLK